MVFLVVLFLVGEIFIADAGAYDINRVLMPETVGVIQETASNQYAVCEDCPLSRPLSETEKPVPPPAKPLIAISFSSGTPIEHVKPAEEKHDEARVDEKRPIDEKKPITVYFDFDSSSLKGGEKQKLKAAYRDIEGKELRVVGYTCDLGPQVYNERLAVRRAESVARYLTALGVPEALIKVEGRGKCCYFDPTKRTVNRRVEINQQH